MPDNDIIQIKKLTDISDQIKRNQVSSKLASYITDCVTSFQSAYQERRNKLLEINALYRCLSYLDKRRTEWQTKSFVPLVYDAVERKTSILHEALWGNRLASPFTAIGRTSEDQAFAPSAETVLNNTMDRIGFFEISEEGLRSCCKYGMGVYRYGMESREEQILVRETIRDEKGKVRRDEANKPLFKYAIKTNKTRQPFVRNIDIVDHFGWDPTCKRFDKWDCSFVYEIREETKERIAEKVKSGEYLDVMSQLDMKDPYGTESYGLDAKLPMMKRDDGIQITAFTPKDKYLVIDFQGWFDIDGDGKREFINCTILEKRLLLSAEENFLGEYQFIDIPYSRSLHAVTPWGVVDPVISIQYEINELHCQRGDNIKLKLNQQFAINLDKIVEDHAYVSEPGALHPFHTGDEPVSNALVPLQFQSLEHVSQNEEEMLKNDFAKAVGVADFNKALNTSNKNTPASTVISLMNEQQSGNSMIVNGVLNKHGVLGERIFRLIQLFGDEEFILRTAGRQGLQFRRESLANILGQYDIKVTTSSFFGNKNLELQHLMQLKPMWAQAPHIDQIELDRAILENILPKRIDQILKVPQEPLRPQDEQLLFIVGKGGGMKPSTMESMADVKLRIQAHQKFASSKAYEMMTPEDKSDFTDYIERLVHQFQQLQMQQQLMAQQAAKGMPEAGGMDGNQQNTGLPQVRQMGQAMRPQPNNIPVQ